VDAADSWRRNPAGTIRFGPFELDVRAGELRRGVTRIRLSDQPLRVLLILLERPGEVVLREDIRDRLWPGSTVVEFDHSINAAVRRLRDALRESADQPRYIETIPRRGYRFICRLETPAGKVEPPEEFFPPVLPASGLIAAPLVGRPSEGSAEALTNGVVSPGGIDVPAATPRDSPTSRNRLFRVVAMVAGLTAAAAVAFVLRPTLPPPRVTRSTQLTKDGRAKATMVTDGSRIYFSYAGYGNGKPLYQVSTAGGDPVPFLTSITDPIVLDISPDRSRLLVAGRSAGQCCSFWLFPVLGGSPRSLGQVRASLLDRGDRGSSPDAAWSPDGREVVYVQGNSLWRAGIDGTGSRKIVSVAAEDIPTWPRWSPDGKHLRFSVQTRDGHSSLWEVTADGSKLHRLLPGWTDPSSECCGSWTPDGNYFIFQSERGGSTNICAVREKASLFRKAGHEPVQLTTGPMSTYGALPSADGKRLFVVSAKVRGEVVRYDEASRQFMP
jgi:DNA-binding winged helix-turn-helix (wHTH) protein